jgi:hypothetical protein
MTERIPQSTAKTVVFKAYLSSDHVSEATSKTIAITISKNGGAFGNPNAGATNATEISSGWYKVALDTTDTGTLGPLAIRGAVATIDDVGVLIEVVSATTGGYTNLDAAISSRMATYTQPTGFLAATFPTTVASTTNITAATGITVSTNSDKTGYSLSQSFPTNFSSLAITVGGAVTVGTNSDKTGYTVSTVSDKTGYALISGYDPAKTAAQAGDAMALTSSERNSTADALLDRTAGVETNRTLRQSLRLMLAALVGKASGLATATATFRDTNDTKDRIVATVDTNGNRSAVTLDGS